MLKIAFVIRNDGLTKGGGDIDQARQFSSLIADPGRVATSVIRFIHLNVADFDLIVLFNIDMPFENYLVARQCVARRIPYVIYTLHPKASHVEDFLRNGTIRTQYLAAGVAGYSLLNYETIACIVRLARTKRWRQLLSYRPAAHSARYVLQHAMRVLVSCTGEAEYIRRDFATDARFEVLRHLVDESGLAQSPEPFPRNAEGYVLCAGRIEPRKNQMAVVEVAKACPGHRFLFLGKKNMNHGQYVRNFETAVSAHANVEWRDHLPLPTLQNLISSARAYINLSWFEVFSLIDMMALTSQTPSILSTGSYLYDQLQSCGEVSGVEFVDPGDIAAAKSRLISLPRQAAIARGFVMNESWTESAIRQKWGEIECLVKTGSLHAASP
jgi:glycosyltransferase involved in cell wall biosynthesis